MFLNADPHTVGKKSSAMVPLRIQRFRSCTETSSPSIYAIIRSSSCSTAVSTNCSLYLATRSIISAGISSILKFSGRPESSHTYAFSVNISTTPLKSSSSPIGRVITSGFAPRTFFICSTTRKKSAPILSSLLMKITLATLESFAYRQFVSD